MVSTTASNKTIVRIELIPSHNFGTIFRATTSVNGKKVSVIQDSGITVSPRRNGAYKITVEYDEEIFTTILADELILAKNIRRMSNGKLAVN